MSDVAGGILLIGVGVGALYAAYSGVPQELWKTYQAVKPWLAATPNASPGSVANQDAASAPVSPNPAPNCADQLSFVCKAALAVPFLAQAAQKSGQCECPASNGGNGDGRGTGSAAGGPPVVPGGPSGDNNGGSGHGHISQGGPYAATVLPNGRLAWTPVPSAPTGSF